MALPFATASFFITCSPCLPFTACVPCPAAFLWPGGQAGKAPEDAAQRDLSAWRAGRGLCYAVCAVFSSPGDIWIGCMRNCRYRDAVRRNSPGSNSAAGDPNACFCELHGGRGRDVWRNVFG